MRKWILCSVLILIGAFEIFLYLAQPSEEAIACEEAKRINDKLVWSYYVQKYPDGPCQLHAKEKIVEFDELDKRIAKAEDEGREKMLLSRMRTYDKELFENFNKSVAQILSRDDMRVINDSSQFKAVKIKNLYWQTPTFKKRMNWDQAVEYCFILKDEDNHHWGVPTIDQARDLIDGCRETMSGGDCKVDMSCTRDRYYNRSKSCANFECQATSCRRRYENRDGFCYWPAELEESCEAKRRVHLRRNHYITLYNDYWTLTEVENSREKAWVVDYKSGAIFSSPKNTRRFVRCVSTKKLPAENSPKSGN